MGCMPSKGKEYYNKDVDTKRKLLTGIHLSREAGGIEANLQVAFSNQSKRRYGKAKL